MEDETSRSSRPILITGTYRSGSTWVGKMLAFSPDVHYVHEPFAPMYERSWVRVPPTVRMLHEPADADSPFSEDLQRIATLRPPWVAIARRAGGLRNALRIGEEAFKTIVARQRGARALIKDPFALLLAEWLARSVDSQVVVLVRHPAAFVSSVKRLAWRFDTNWLLGQPALMKADLQEFRDDLIADRQGSSDIIDHAILMWRVFNSVVVRYEMDHPDWNIIRYEDLASDPVPRFHSLCKALDVPWSARLAERIAEENGSLHSGEVAIDDRGGTQRNSRVAMQTWTHRLTQQEINHVRERTEDVARHWYGDSDWQTH